MRRLISLCAAALIGITIGMLILADSAMHVQQGFLSPSNAAADTIARNTTSTWGKAQVTANDGVVLDGWIFTPRNPNGSAVIALHGVSDTRLGMLGHAAFLLRAGFTVLVPDSRGHGNSGGRIITYGIKEAADVDAWSDWLLRNSNIHRLFGIGQSMGAAILIESLKVEPHFCAIVADSPFASFEEIAYDRLHQISGLPKPMLWPIIEVGFAYARLRYRVDLWQASAINAIRAARIPTLLIHGTADTNIPIRHSEELHAANPNMTKLWAVPGAEHVASLSSNPAIYTTLVVNWFRAHTCESLTPEAPSKAQRQ